MIRATQIVGKCYSRSALRTCLKAGINRKGACYKEISKNCDIGKKYFLSTQPETERINDFYTSSDYDDNHNFSSYDATEKNNLTRNNNNNNMIGLPRTSVLMELNDRIGILHEVLSLFWKYDVNLTRIESRPNPEYGQHNKFDFYVVFDGKPGDNANIDKLLHDLNPITTGKLLILDDKKVDWFPQHISELDLIATRILDAGKDLESDHPGFNDIVYRTRRAELASTALSYYIDKPIPTIKYNYNEIATWTAVWDKLEPLWDKYACKQALTALLLMKEHCGYSRDNIPQQEDVSAFLMKCTNFRMRPVAGLLSSRDFLNGLAFRVFFSTQYIRHHSMPLYTPEPDICHELLGHAPMFVDPDFADFSQEIGLASLGATDADILKLARLYWHSIEFGVCRDNEDSNNNGLKAYGAGLLSSFGEIEHACNSDKPELKPWDPNIASEQDFPITTYQPTYFVAESLQDAKDKMRLFCQDLHRPFFASYNKQLNTVHIDRPVERSIGRPD